MATERVRAIAVLIVVFLAGALTGAGLMASSGPHRGPHGRGGHRLPPPLEELDLTSEQRRQAEVVFEKYRPQLDAVFAESQPKLNAVREQLDSELMPMLTEAQRERFEKLKRERPKRGPPHP